MTRFERQIRPAQSRSVITSLMADIAGGLEQNHTLIHRAIQDDVNVSYNVFASFNYQGIGRVLSSHQLQMNILSWIKTTTDEAQARLCVATNYIIESGIGQFDHNILHPTMML